MWVVVGVLWLFELVVDVVVVINVDFEMVVVGYDCDIDDSLDLIVIVVWF